MQMRRLDPPESEHEIKYCPVTKQKCGFDQCSFWLNYRDWEGCPLDLAESSLKEVALKAAQAIDGIIKKKKN